MRKDNVNIRALKLLHSFCPSYFPLIAARSFFGKLAPYFNLYFSAEIVDEISGARDRGRLVALVLAIVLGNFAIAVAGSILNRIAGHKETVLSQREEAYCIGKTLTLDYVDLEDAQIRQLRRRIAEAARIDYHGRQLLTMSVGRLADITATAALSLALGIEMFVRMSAADPGWSLVLFWMLLSGLVAFHVWYSFREKDRMSALSQEVSQTMADENRIDDAVDCYNMGKDVRLYRQDRLIMAIKNYAFELHRKAFRRMASGRFLADIPLAAARVCLQAAVYLFVCVYALKGAFGVGSIVKYAGFVEAIAGCVASYFSVFADIKYNTPFVRDYMAYFDIPRKMCRGTVPVKKGCGSREAGYEIEFCNVSFRYPSSDVYALRNVSLKCRAGERLAIVGMNGSGKTTFVKLMCRLYDPTEGEIRLNGIDIREYGYEEYLSMFSVVFQDFRLFAFSLGQNVAAASAYDAAKARDCLAKAGFGGRLSSMPHGLETCLYRDFDKEGVEVSGGEAQKIALARALYKDASFIVLDEPTAALDPASEYEIYARFNEIARSRTTVFISHRLASCRFCDTIAVFDHGEVVQTGSHEKLLKDASGKYSELWNAQAQWYK